MGKYVLTFFDIKIEKNKFCCHKTPIFKKDVDIEKLIVFTKIFLRKQNYKYLIGYLHNDDKVRPLHIMLTKKNTYINRYNGITKWNIFG